MFKGVYFWSRFCCLAFLFYRGDGGEVFLWGVLCLSIRFCFVLFFVWVGVFLGEGVRGSFFYSVLQEWVF